MSRASDMAIELSKGAVVSYNCTVQGFFYETGELIEPGQVVNVQDVYMSLSSDLIIDSVTFSYNERSGSTARLNMLVPDAFTLTANQPTFAQSGNDLGFDWSSAVAEESQGE